MMWMRYHAFDNKLALHENCIGRADQDAEEQEADVDMDFFHDVGVV